MPPRRGKRFNPPATVEKEEKRVDENDDTSLLTQKDPQPQPRQRVLRSADVAATATNENKRPKIPKMDPDFPILPSKFTDEELGLNNTKKRGRRRKVRAPSTEANESTEVKLEVNSQPNSQPEIPDLLNQPESTASKAEEFSTVDASGLQDLVLTDSHTVTASDGASATTTAPLKRRGRKPKAKKESTKSVKVEKTIGGLTFPSDGGAPATFAPSMTVNENGILSIDMSHIAPAKVPADVKDPVVKPVTVKVEKKRRMKNMKNSEDVKPKIKRGRPKAVKGDSSASAPSSPVVKPIIRRGRKGGNTGGVKTKKVEPFGGGGGQTTHHHPKGGLDVGDMEPDEVIDPADLVGYEDVEIYDANIAINQKLDELSENENGQGFSALMRKAQRALQAMSSSGNPNSSNSKPVKDAV